MEDEEKKKSSVLVKVFKVIGIIIGCIFLLLVLLVVGSKFLWSKVEHVIDSKEVLEIEIDGDIDGDFDNYSKGLNDSNGSDDLDDNGGLESVIDSGENVGDNNNEENVIVDDNYVKYSNSFLGIEFLYPSEWYINENNVETINTLKNLGYTYVDITTDVLDDLHFVTIAARDKLDTEITVNIATVVGAVSENYGRSDVREIARGMDDLSSRRTWNDSDKGVFNYIDVTSKQELGDYDIIEYHDSVIKEYKDKNYILTEYMYKTKFEEFSVVKVTVLAGVNMVTFKAVSLVGESNIDKLQIIEGVIDTFKILG